MEHEGWIKGRRRLIAALLALASAAHGQASARLDVDAVVRAMGKTGEAIGETYKISYPRSDLRVTAGKVAIKPALALTTWAAFKKDGDSSVAYGDLVLLEDEINPAISKLEENGVEVSALHNHLIHENPRVMYIHFMGHGDAAAMAKGIREALTATRTPLQAQPAAPAETKPETAERIEKVLGHEGKMGGGVFHVNVPRQDIQVKMMGVEIPGNMGMNTPLNFQIDGEKAAINGDFMLLAGEVNPVIKALRAGGIEVAALHNHMLDEEPRLFFIHFWAYGDAVALAKGLKTALNVQKK